VSLSGKFQGKFQIMEQWKFVAHEAFAVLKI
jgi:hypothetical protein